ncbi:FAD-linked oxidase C-terminal domain-containing protein [Novosphingobium panipatense]
MEASHVARLTQRPEHPAATEAVKFLRKGVVAICARHGTGHFQIGRTYPYRESRDPAFTALLDTLKAHLDPKGLFNPGVLGFSERQG